MIIPSFSGRYGNILLENIGYSILSKKFNLSVYYSNEDRFKCLGLNLYKGGRNISNITNYQDDTLMDLLSINDMNNGIFYNGNFQVKEFVLQYRNEILNHFNLEYRNQDNEDLFVHVRLGDVKSVNPGINYYRNCLNNIKFKNGYISSDSIDSQLVTTLVNEYKLIKFIDDPIKTIDFAKDFKNIILSKGTFSWWIGLLSRSDNVMYPKEKEEWPNPPHWHGNIFVFDEWKGIEF